MLFPSPSPSLEECTQRLAEALQNDGGRIYLDANVLIHCYEMSAGASEDLIKTLERYGDRVGVPVWAARETWDFITKRSKRKPLASLAGRMRKDFTAFRRETTRYIDDSALRDQSKDDFQRELGEALDAVVEKIHLVSQHEPRVDQTTDRVLPFIEARRLPSKMRPILDQAARTAPFRMAHRVPPGFADAPPPSVDEEETEPDTPKPRGKGKTFNANGDLIIWYEILEDCARNEAEHLIIVTKEQKEDWVYLPKKVRDDQGRLQNNGTGIMLPQPLLVYEAKEVCPSLQTVSIVSVESLAGIWTTQSFDVARLAAALQAEGDDGEREVTEEETSPSRADNTSEQDYVAEFRSSDLNYEPSDTEELGRLLLDLGVEGWRLKNKAVRRLVPQLGNLDRSQRIYVGRELASAALAGAVEPAELFDRVLADGTLSRALRSDLLIGVLAQTYIDDAGEPKKPMAARPITDTLYAKQNNPDLVDAFAAVLQRLAALTREYLALPAGEDATISLDIALQSDQLVNVTAGDFPLLEADAPPSRALQRSGNDAVMTIAELLDVLAKEFVVPVTWLTTDTASTTKVTVPETLGFVVWGPTTGKYLR